MSLRLRWLGAACFEFRLDNGEGVMVDPYLDESISSPVRSDQISRADVICITHGHFDHILDVGRLALRLKSTVICSRQVAQNVESRFGVPAKQIRPVTAGEVVKQGGLTIEVVKAIHMDNRTYFAQQMGMDPSSAVSTEDMVRRVFGSIEDAAERERFLSYMGKYPAGEQLNFIFQSPGNLRVHFLGSMPSPELFSLVEGAQAQILILQILRGMEERAVDLARRSRASLVFPSHHDAFFPGQKLPDMEKVKELFDRAEGQRFIPIEPGTWYELRMAVRIGSGSSDSLQISSAQRGGEIL